MCDCSTTIAVADTRQGYLVRLTITAETLTIAGEGVAQPRRTRRRVRASTSILRITRYIPPRTLVRVSEPDIDSAVQGDGYPGSATSGAIPRRARAICAITQATFALFVHPCRLSTGSCLLIVPRSCVEYKGGRTVEIVRVCARRPRNGACRSASYTICVLSIGHY